jgi:hypothetical protein
MLCTHTRILELFQYHYDVNYVGSYNSNTNVPKVPQSEEMNSIQVQLGFDWVRIFPGITTTIDIFISYLE